MADQKDIQMFRTLLEKWIDQDRAKRLILQSKQAPESKETLAQRSLRKAEEFTSEPVIEEVETQDIQADKWILQKGWEAVSEFWTEAKFELKWAEPGETFWQWLKREVVNLWKLGSNIWTDILEIAWGTADFISNIWTDILEIAWGTADFIWEVIDEPGAKVESAKTLWQWFLWLIRKAGRFWLELWSGQELDISKDEKIANAIWEGIKKEAIDKFWTIEKARKTLTENPLDAFLFVRGWLKWLKDSWLSKADQARIKELTKESDVAIEQFLKPTKWTTKQITKKITPEIQKRLKDWRLKPGDRETIKEITDANVESVWKDIWEFISAWKVKWEVDFDWMIDVLVKADSKARVDWNIIPWREAEVKFINSQLDFLWQLQKTYWKNLPADKQLELKRQYDVVFDKTVTRDKITKFQDELQVELADILRVELAKNNPDLDILNKEFTFNKWLQKVLDETLERTAWQDPVWLINRIDKIQQWGAWATIWATIGGTTWWPLGAAVWALFWWALWLKLTKVMASPKYRLADAKKKAELADAIASWDATKVEKILDTLTISLGITTISDDNE